MLEPPSLGFDLVVATLGRSLELERLLVSLEAQTHRLFRVLVVDQNEDERTAAILAAHAGLELVHLRAQPGLSRARNAALGRLRADVVAFPDDDCVYPPDLLERVARRLAAEPALDGLTGRAVDGGGASSTSWKHDAAGLTETNLWNRAISYTIFLRRALVERVGAFDERLGLGSGEPWSSGEEIDYLVRALGAGACIAYDPELTVIHELRPDSRATGYRDGASLGYVLRKNGYPAREKARRLLRPLGGILLSLVRLDRDAAAFHLATLRGRLDGLRGGR